MAAMSAWLRRGRRRAAAEVEIALRRDCVAMGDEPDPSLGPLRIAGDRTLGAALCAALEQYPLAGVGADVSWVARIRLPRDLVDHAGTRHGPEEYDLALIHVPHRTGERTVIPLSRNHLGTRISEMVARAGGGPLMLHFQYLSEGAQMSTEDFRRIFA